MTFANPAALWLLSALVPVLALHLLRPQRVDTIVSSQLLWRAEQATATAARPWQPLTRSASLLLQILTILLATLALANPVSRSATELASHTVFVVDASASMGATDGSPDRLSDAKATTLALWDELPTGGTASVIAGGPDPRVIVTSTNDPERFEAAIRSVRLTRGPFDLGAAMALADGLESVDETIAIVLVSDGAHDDEDLASLPTGVTHQLVGSQDINRAITSLSVAPVLDDPTMMSVTATVEVTGGPEAALDVRFDVDGATVHVAAVVASPETPVTINAEVETGAEVVARFDGDDILAADDVAYALARQEEAVTATVSGVADPFLDSLLASLPGVRIVDPEREIPDVRIFNGEPVPAEINQPFWAIASPGGFAGITPGGVIDNPVPTLVQTSDPLLVGLDLSRLVIAQAQRLEAPTADVLVGAEGAPLVMRGRRDGLPFVWTAFSLADSSLPLDVAFPVFGDRLLQELASSGIVPGSRRVGDEITAPPGRAVTVVAPDGTQSTLRPGIGSVTIDRPGFWTLEPSEASSDASDPVVGDAPTAARRATTIAANGTASESRVAPLPVAPSEPRSARAGERSPTVEQSFRNWALAALGLTIIAEWRLWTRRSGVPAWQRRLAHGLRVLSLIGLAVTALGIRVPFPSNAMATIFVIDRSDSLGPAGQREALEWARQAIQMQIEDDGSARSGSVLSADGARVDRLLADRDYLVTNAVVQIDADRTDLAAGLRLAGALLPDDTRRRIVVVSDGRATTGDAVREAAALAERGIAVDYALIDSRRLADASVSSVRAPNAVDEGEAVVVEGIIESSVAQPALVTLRRGDVTVGSTEVALDEGTNVVRLRDPNPTGGLALYDMRVETALDTQPRNDIGRVAVHTGGRARVLVVGDTAAVEGLAAVLTSAEIDVEVIAPGALPEAAELAAFDSVVLVNVGADRLREDQMQALVANTRDLGRGLVTIGGTDSYGMGGWRGTTLESALPVISDVLDPLRRRTIAEVFALDTSESMGNCHCAEDGAPTDRIAGGVTKTEIVRAGAARAIANLTSDDEVGILAVDTGTQWLLDLQPLPSADLIDAGLAQVTPAGNTDLTASLNDAAAQLRQSDAGLKHIILFTDGFTSAQSLRSLRLDAADLFNEGITVSIVGTGEGAATELQEIAEAGGGRFYPGRDLSRIPEILVEESIIASRNFIHEGEFVPTITASSPITETLTSAPVLGGYVATTAKPTASTILVLGNDDDPLLATWRHGLGRATSWTSDAGTRWAGDWIAWEDGPQFWTQLVRDSFPLESSGAVRATIDGDELQVRIENAEGGTPVQANVTDPDGAQRPVDLVETSVGVFVGSIRIGSAGTYSVAAWRPGDGSSGTETELVPVGSDIATLSYPAEYRPGSPSSVLLAEVSAVSGGRGEVEPERAFDTEGLAASSRRIDPSGWLLPVAVAVWLAAIVFSRFLVRRRSLFSTGPSTPPDSQRQGDPSGADQTRADQISVTTRLADQQTLRPGASHGGDGTPRGSASPEPSTPEATPPADPPSPAPTSLEQLLRDKRDRS